MIFSENRYTLFRIMR